LRRAIAAALPGVGLALFAYIVLRAGPGRIAAALGDIAPARLLVFPLITLVIIGVRGWRWRVILSSLAIDYPLRRCAEVWTIGFFASAVTPGKLGDAVRALYVHRETGRGLGVSFLAVFVDRLLDLLVIVLLALIALPVFSRLFWRVPYHWLLLAASMGLLALLLLALRRDLVRALLAPAYRWLVPERFKNDLAQGFHGFYDALAAFRRDRRRSLAALLLTVAYWLIVFGLVRTLAWAMALPVGYGYIALTLPAVTVAEFLPISLSGLGPREAAIVFFFSVLGIPAPQALAFSLVYWLVGTVLTSLIGLVYWLRRPIRFASAGQARARN
jgi:hypothetical protein